MKLRVSRTLRGKETKKEEEKLVVEVARCCRSLLLLHGGALVSLLA